MIAEAKPKVFIDNERVRVTEWRFAPGAATGWHRRETDYAVMPMADGELELIGQSGERTRAQLSKGVPYFRSAGAFPARVRVTAFWASAGRDAARCVTPDSI